VCSPTLVAARTRIRGPADVVKFPLLHLDSREGWSKWLAEAGAAADLTRGPVLNRVSMLIDAAVDGQGVALARTTLAAWDVLAKRLVRPFGLALPLSKSYWIVCPKATAAVPKITIFRDWLLAEAADDIRRVAAIDKGQPAARFR
jgi:LysR family glycine cleavage system transcriptional activator